MAHKTTNGKKNPGTAIVICKVTAAKKTVEEYLKHFAPRSNRTLLVAEGLDTVDRARNRYTVVFKYYHFCKNGGNTESDVWRFHYGAVDRLELSPSARPQFAIAHVDWYPNEDRRP